MCLPVSTFIPVRWSGDLSPIKMYLAAVHAENEVRLLLKIKTLKLRFERLKKKRIQTFESRICNVCNNCFSLTMFACDLHVCSLMLQTCVFKVLTFNTVLLKRFNTGISVTVDWVTSLTRTDQTRENVPQSLLHTISRKHVIQPRNDSKTTFFQIQQASDQPGWELEQMLNQSHGF